MRKPWGKIIYDNVAMKDKEDLSKLKPWQKKLHVIIFGIDTRAGRLFDIALLITILLSVVVVMLESVQEISAKYGNEIRLIEWLFTIFFTLEFIARLLSSPKPAKYYLSFMGIIDFVSLIPTYLSIFVAGTHALSIIRTIRLIRVFRILKLTRFIGGANQLGNSLYQSRHKISVFMTSVLCIVVIMGTLLYLIEGGENGFSSIPKSIYWAIVTITTVGYGDIAPQTIFGQTIASVLMILGYAILAVPTGIVTSEMMKSNGHSGSSCDDCGESNLPKGAVYCHKCGAALE